MHIRSPKLAITVGTGLVFAACIATVLRPAASPRSAPPQLESGGEIALVFLASSTCPGVRDPRLPAALEAARDLLEAYAAETGRHLVTIGIALDPDTETGSRLLETFGPFDEEHIGRAFLNAAAVRYLADMPGGLAIPQIVVVERDVSIRGGLMGMSNERVLSRKVGAEMILDWTQMAASRGLIEG